MVRFIRPGFQEGAYLKGLVLKASGQKKHAGGAKRPPSLRLYRYGKFSTGLKPSLPVIPSALLRASLTLA